MNRRSFVKYSAATFAAVCAKPAFSIASKPNIEAANGILRVKTSHYSFFYSQKDDTFSIDDAIGYRIASAPMQPVVIAASSADPTKQTCAPGRGEPPQVSGNRALIQYAKVNGEARLTITLRFDENGFWFEPIIYESPATEDIVSVHYFSSVKGKVPTPALCATYITVPGIAENDAISPVEVAGLRHEQTISLGHSGFYVPPFTTQQWGLPVHYFCAMSTHAVGELDDHQETWPKRPKVGYQANFANGRSETMVCGLADMPNGDLLIDLHNGLSSLWIDYRSDLWHHLRTPGKLMLGSTLAFAFGDGQHGGITSYYMQLLDAGIICRKQNSTAKNAVALAPQFCTWGAQLERGNEGEHLTEEFLEHIYAEMKACGMKASIFSIDDKWEGHYGNLEHSHERLPHFVEFLDRIRAEGHQVGLWTAFMRCEDPADLGLEMKHMLQKPDGTPYKAGNGTYHILDFTHPEVAEVLTKRTRAFVRHYRPAVVKFDFGYELPAVRDAAPFDKRYAGERVLKKGLDVVVSALRAEDPDIVVMYYQLSPLFVEYFDLHSTDDLYLAAGDYDWEANRRIYFASVLTQLGVPVYGSSGYDWSSSPVIWFDSVASGTIGSLNDFQGDEFGEYSTPERIALYNGLAQTIRPGNLFTVIPFPPARPEAATRGAHSKSWARLEDGRVTIIAQRPPSFDDGDMLEHRPLDPRIDKLITTTVPVVVSSKTADSISASSHLAVVGCAEGTVSIHRAVGTTAQITTHHFGGEKMQSSAPLKNGILTLSLHRKGSSGQPIEWMEIKIS